MHMAPIDIPEKHRSPAFSHPTWAWREWLSDLNQDKVRFEVIWYRLDLANVGVRLPVSQTCVICEEALEVTPVAIRVAYGASYRQDPAHSNATPIPRGSAVLLFTKVCRGDCENAVDNIFQDGIWPTHKGRNQIFFSGALPHQDCWLSAINNPRKMRFQCEWSKQDVDMNQQHIYKPGQPGIWLFVDYEKLEERVQGMWHHTGQFPYVEDVILPKYVVATLTESTMELHITDTTRFDEIVKGAKETIKAFHDSMKESGREPRVPETTVADREGHASRALLAEKRIMEQAWTQRSSQEDNDTEDKFRGRPGERQHDEEQERWLCYHCDRLVVASTDVCPIPGCPGTSPKMRLHLGKGTEANRAVYA